MAALSSAAGRRDRAPARVGLSRSGLPLGVSPAIFGRAPRIRLTWNISCICTLHAHCTGVQGHLRVNVERVDDFDEEFRFGGLGRVLDPGPGERVGLDARDDGLFADFARVVDLDGGVSNAAAGSRLIRRNQPVS
jgi:hypothetical protein